MQKPWKNLCDSCWKNLCRCFWIYFEQKQWTTASERKCAADIFYVEENEWPFLETFQCFFKERVAASEKILRKNNCFWNLLKEKNVLLKDINIKKKICSCLCLLKKYFEVKQPKIKVIETLRKPVTFMYFWLNYCNENIERIPVAVKNID